MAENKEPKKPPCQSRLPSVMRWDEMRWEDVNFEPKRKITGSPGQKRKNRNYNKSRSEDCSVEEFLVFLLTCGDSNGRMGFLPLPFPKPAAGGGANFGGASWGPGELKKSPKSFVSCWEIFCCTEGIIQSFSFRGGAGLAFILRLLKLWVFTPLLRLE